MREDISRAELNRELVLRLLHQSARDRAASQRWGINAVVWIGGIFVVILILDLYRLDTWLMAIIALLGLAILWVFGLLRTRKMEKVFYQQELQDYANILPDEAQIDSAKGQPEEPSESPLTLKELDILSMIAKGKTNKEIARALSVNESSIKNQVSRILHNLNVSNRTEAVLLALSHGWLKKDTDTR